MSLWSRLRLPCPHRSRRPSPAANSTIRPAIIYSTGGKFDKSFNEGVSEGVEKFKAETKATVAEFEPSNETQFEQAQRRFAQRGLDPVIAVGFAQATALEKSPRSSRTRTSL